MSPGQLQGLKTHVRDGKPIERSGANRLYGYQDVGEDGYVMPNVFHTHGKGSNEHVHRSVVPHHLVHPGLAYGADIPSRSNVSLGGINDPTLGTVLSSDTLRSAKYSDTLQPNQHPEQMENQRLSSSLFIASSLPGTPYYGQTHRSLYDQPNYRPTAMASSDTVRNTDAMESYRTSEFESNLQAKESHKSQSHAHLYAEELHNSRIDPHLQHHSLQTGSLESHVNSDLHREQSYGSHDHLSSGVVSMSLHVDNKD